MTVKDTRPASAYTTGMAAVTSSGKSIRDLAVLARFIQLYCDGHHAQADRRPAELKFCDLGELPGPRPVLCPACTKLLAHAFFKRLSCPLDPKPACKHCPQHCYQLDYRQRIQDVMRYSGWAMIRRGRLDLLWHMIF